MKKDYSLEKELAALGKKLEDLAQEKIEEAKKEVGLLAAQVHGLILEHASELKSSKSIYEKALSDPQQVGDSIWMVTLDPSANWIEDGSPARDGDQVIQDLLFGKNGKVAAKKGKNGYYKVIPFQHSGGTTTMSRSQSRVAEFAQAEVEKMKLDKVIKDKEGNPYIGKVASANLTGKNSPKSRHNTALLAGLSVYQRHTDPKDKKSPIKRDIMTFRIVSESQKGTGKWKHPGNKPLKAFEKAEQEIDRLWRELVQKISS